MPLGVRRASLGAVRASAVREYRGAPPRPLAPAPMATVGSSAPRGGSLRPAEPRPGPGAHTAAAGALEAPLSPSADRRLTPCERAVADRASHGRTNTQIGTDLDLTFAQVKSALARSFAKLGVSDRAGLVGAGFVCGFLRPRPTVGPLRLPRHLSLFLPLVAAGMTDEAIAAEMLARGLPSGTPPAVRNRMRELCRTLHAVSRAHAVRLAVEAGLLVVSLDGTRLVLADSAGGVS